MPKRSARVRPARLALAWFLGVVAVVLTAAAHWPLDLRPTRAAVPRGRGVAAQRSVRTASGLQAAQPVPPPSDPLFDDVHLEEIFDGGKEWLPGHVGASAGDVAMPDGRVMHWSVFRDDAPRILSVEGMIGAEEAEVLMELARSKLSRSKTIADKGSKTSNVRTSEGAFLDNREPVVKAMRRRISRLLITPRAHIESTQILRYEAGQEYRMHPDFFAQSKLDELGANQQRVATCIVYLNDVGSGGGTKFNTDPVTVFAPTKYAGVCFYSVKREGGVERHALHAGLPPEEGSVKWVAVFWIREGAVGRGKG